MKLQAKLDFYLDHLQGLLRQMDAARLTSIDPGARRVLGRQVGAEFGFVRRVSLALRTDDGLLETRYTSELPTVSAADLDTLQADLARLRWLDHLPSDHDILQELDAISQALFRMFLSAHEAPGAAPSAGDPENSAEILGLVHQADELLSIVCTREALGAPAPAHLLGRTITIGQHARSALPEDERYRILDIADLERDARLLDHDPWGAPLWMSLLDPATRPALWARATAHSAAALHPAPQSRAQQLAARADRLRASFSTRPRHTLWQQPFSRQRPGVALGASSIDAHWENASHEDLRQAMETVGRLEPIAQPGAMIEVAYAADTPHLLCIELPAPALAVCPDTPVEGVFVMEPDLVWLNLDRLKGPVIFLRDGADPLALHFDGTNLTLETLHVDDLL